MTPTATHARADATLEGDTLQVRIGGDWRITEHRPEWSDLVQDRPAKRLKLVADGLGNWDSSLALLLRDARLWSQVHGAAFETEGLPEGAVTLSEMLCGKQSKPPAAPGHFPRLFTLVGVASVALWADIRDIAQLVGECIFSMSRFFRGRAQFRWKDCFTEMQQCGAMALPIVSLISFLVGVIMAYQSAVQLRQFGADIYVADLVGLSVVREMGPMMAGIVLAGRTGAAFAATLGNMKANEEIDALSTLGVSAVDFLVMPRMLALFFMMPLLALYSNCVGVGGGLVVSAAILDIPASLYWAETKTIVDLSDMSTGLIKAATFGILVGLSGCLRGLQADRSAAGVGTAATRAVVTGILLIIVSDSIFAVIFNILGW